MPITNYFRCQWTKCTIKNIGWLIELKEKNKTYLYASYIAHFRAKTHTEWKWGMESLMPQRMKSSIYFMEQGSDRKVEVAMLIWDKNLLKNKGQKKRQRRALYDDKGINTRRRYYTH